MTISTMINTLPAPERNMRTGTWLLGYLMKSFGNMENDVEDVVDVYCHQCAIAMNCKELTRAFLFLANHGVNPFNQGKNSDGQSIQTSGGP